MEKLDYENFEMLVSEAGKLHGDICAGISIGTRMTMSGLRRMGLPIYDELISAVPVTAQAKRNWLGPHCIQCRLDDTA